MRKKILYTCDICQTDYADENKAKACEKGHKLLETATITGKYKPIGMVSDGAPVTISVKFKGTDKWIEYKRF